MDVNLPPDLDRWLKSRADQIGVEPELLLHQLVDSYRTTGSEEETQDPPGDPFSGGPSRDRFSANRSSEMDVAVLESLLDEKLDEWVAEDLEATIDERVAEAVESELETTVESQLSDAVESKLDERLDSRIEAAVDEALDSTVETRIEEALSAETDALDDRIDELEAEHTDAIEDVRDRVIQVKKEADAKTPTEAHEETRRDVEDLQAELSTLDDRLASISEELSALQSETTDRLDDHAETLADLESGVEDTEERLNTLAWNVNKIRDHVETAKDLSPILQKAAQLDIDRAKCDQCEAAVEIGLLTEPACPHCGAQLTGVVDSRSFFGKPRLLVGDDQQ